MEIEAYSTNFKIGCVQFQVKPPGSMTESETYRAAHAAAHVVHADAGWVRQTAEDSPREHEPQKGQGLREHETSFG